MAHALPRKIKLAFILQALVASLVMALGVSAAATAVRQVLVRQRLHEEAALVWQQAVDTRTPALPRHSRMRSYFIPPGGSLGGVPAELATAPSQMRLPLWGRPAVLVEQRPSGKLILMFDPSLGDEAIFWTAGLSLLLALLVTYVSAWLTYRTSKRLVAPVSWLANAVARWDPRAPTADTLAPHHLPLDSGTEVRRLARALNGLARRIGEYVERERHFTRDASHELRTPLTVIRVATDIMAADPALPPRMLRAVGRIQRAGHDMQTVIDAFFILARDAEVEAESERFDIHEVVDDQVEFARELIGDKPVELRVLDEGGSFIDAPRRVLALMVGNLLDNAIRYTERGHVEVVMRSDRIVIRDTGVGMSEEAVAKAFDPFYREDREREGGMGIGLSIVRRLGERFGWPVELSSALGKGTIATIHLRG